MRTYILLLAISLTSCSLCFAQNWVPFSSLPGSGTTAMKSNQNGDLFVTTASYNYPSGQSAGVYRSLEGEATLINVSPVQVMYNARAIETEGNNLVWASCWTNPSLEQEALYYSSNNGSNWTRTYQIGTSNNIFSIKADSENNNVYIGARNGVHKSTNNGASFTLSNSGIPFGAWTFDIEKASGKLYAGTAKGLYYSSDLGGNWQPATGIPADTIKSLAVIPSLSGDRLVAGTNDGELYVSDETLIQFAQIFGFENSDIIAMLVLLGVQPGDFHFILSAFPKNFDILGNGLYYSYNSSNSFSDFGQGLPLPYRASAIGGYMQGNSVVAFAGTFNNTQNGAVIYKKTYTVGINIVSSEIPDSYSLLQNYPNPFNPSTKIRFNIKEYSRVKMSVYNAGGTRVSVILDQEIEPGEYETIFRPEGLPSGAYFLRMQVFGKSEALFTKKMILTK